MEVENLFRRDTEFPHENGRLGVELLGIESEELRGNLFIISYLTARLILGFREEGKTFPLYLHVDRTLGTRIRVECDTGTRMYLSPLGRGRAGCSGMALAIIVVTRRSRQVTVRKPWWAFHRNVYQK